MKRAFILAITCFTILTNCKQPEEKKMMKKYAEELHSFAQPNNAVITHLNLDIDVNFESQIISGTATYNISNNNATEIILDAKYLEISEVKADNTLIDIKVSNTDIAIELNPKT